MKAGERERERGVLGIPRVKRGSQTPTPRSPRSLATACATFRHVILALARPPTPADDAAWMAAPPTVAARAVGGADRRALGGSVAALADALLSTTPIDAEAAEDAVLAAASDAAAVSAAVAAAVGVPLGAATSLVAGAGSLAALATQGVRHVTRASGVDEGTVRTVGGWLAGA